MDSQTMYERSGPDWRYRTYGPATTTTRTTTFTMGTLVIDFFTWRGAAEGQVKPNQDADRQKEPITDAPTKGWRRVQFHLTFGKVF